MHAVATADAVVVAVVVDKVAAVEVAAIAVSACQACGVGADGRCGLGAAECATVERERPSLEKTEIKNQHQFFLIKVPRCYNVSGKT